MIDIFVFSEERAWSKKLNKKQLFFKKICKAFPKRYKFLNKKVSLTLLLSNNKNIKKLNKNFRNQNKSTDILSFPFQDKLKNTINPYGVGGASDSIVKMIEELSLNNIIKKQFYNIAFE